MNKRFITQLGLLVAGVLLVGAGCVQGGSNDTALNATDVAAEEFEVVPVSSAGLEGAADVVEGMIPVEEADESAGDVERDDSAAIEDTEEEGSDVAEEPTEEETVLDRIEAVSDVEATTNGSSGIEETTEVVAEQSVVEEPAAEEAGPEEATEAVVEETQEVVEEKTEEQEEQKQITVSIVVVSPSNARSTYSATINKGGTVEDAMKAAKSDGLSYKVKQFGGMGAYVEAINGDEEDGGMYWVFYVNGARAISGISTQTLSKGDEITWKYRPPGAAD